MQLYECVFPIPCAPSAMADADGERSGPATMPVTSNAAEVPIPEDVLPVAQQSPFSMGGHHGQEGQP